MWPDNSKNPQAAGSQAQGSCLIRVIINKPLPKHFHIHHLHNLDQVCDKTWEWWEAGDSEK